MTIPVISVTVFSIMIFICAVSCIRTKNIMAFIGFLSSYLVFWLYIYLENKFAFHVIDLILLLVVITLFGHFYLGENLRLYYITKYYDRYLHLFGTISFTLMTYSIIRYTLNPTFKADIILIMFIVSWGVFLGVIFELIEFILDLIFKTKNQSGLVDTNVDLIFDILGALVASGIIVYFKGRYF